MKKKVLITGVRGMLGRAVYSKIVSKSETYDIYGLGRATPDSLKLKDFFEGDLSDTNFIHNFSGRNQFDFIVHCAGITNLRQCEVNKKYVEKVHVDASLELAAHNPNAIIIYISTDSVFDGEKGDYSEKDSVDPLNAYALQKFQGEKSIQRGSGKYYIFRLNIYGFHTPFGNSLFEWGYKSLVEKRKINGYKNVIFNPLYVGQVSEIIRCFMDDMPKYGIYNLGSYSPVSKYGFLLKIAKYFNFNKNLITPVEANFSDSEIRRPLNTSLNISKLKEVVKDIDLSLENGFVKLTNDFTKVK